MLLLSVHVNGLAVSVMTAMFCSIFQGRVIRGIIINMVTHLAGSGMTSVRVSCGCPLCTATTVLKTLGADGAIALLCHKPCCTFPLSESSTVQYHRSVMLDLLCFLLLYSSFHHICFEVSFFSS
ncbi:hypothetical protein BKA81DRAFT_362090 [Phyllosticta paracitricarpa]|uniref:Secreted protein n=1 Tax=Phyllosticta citricarpa TaxID=55181 RepID=A0ABR1MCR8_9PEZI